MVSLIAPLLGSGGRHFTHTPFDIKTYKSAGWVIHVKTFIFRLDGGSVWVRVCSRTGTSHGTIKPIP